MTKAQQEQKELVDKHATLQTLITTYNSELKGVLLGILAVEGVDPEQVNVSLKEDFTEVNISDKPVVTPAESSNGEIIEDAVIMQN